MAGNAFKSAVPYIGIKKMDGAVSSMEFGTFPDKMNIWNEQKQAFKASYWPTVKFSAFVEVGGNTLYRAVDEAKESYGNVMYENEVAIARYMAAMTWNASLGIGLKSFVWLFMQGATCMVPNMKTAVKLIGYQGALKGIQFGTAAGLSYGYSYWTSDAFFWLRNFTLHTMGLYTESEMAAQMPLKEVVAGQEVNTLSDLGIDADGTVELSEKTAVVDRTHDSEILAELSFEQIPWWEAEDSPEWDLEEQE